MPVVTNLANSSMCFSNRSLYLKRIRALRIGGIADQAGKAAFAADMACSTSLASAKTTCLSSSPVAGVKDSLLATALALNYIPVIK